MPEWRREYCENVLSGFGGIVIARDMDQGLEFVNQYAPEHLEILTRDPFETLPRMINAGEVILIYSFTTKMVAFFLSEHKIRLEDLDLYAVSIAKTRWMKYLERKS